MTRREELLELRDNIWNLNISFWELSLENKEVIREIGK